MTTVDDVWFNVFVAGKPVPQGSKQARPIYKGRGADRVFTDKVALVEVAKNIKPWRDSIRSACQDPMGQPLCRFGEYVAVVAHLVFVMPRVSGLPKTKAAPHHTKKPDVDKLTRAVFDALTSAGIWHDDAQVVDTDQKKRYAAPGETPGCYITLYTAEAPAEPRPAVEQQELQL